MIQVMAKVRGECLFCSTRLPLYLKLKNADFCSEAHKQSYYEQQQQLALARLLETEKILSGARARKIPLREPRGTLTGNDAPRLGASRDPIATVMAGPIVDLLDFRVAAACPLTAGDPVAFKSALAIPTGPALDLAVHPLHVVDVVESAPEPPVVEELAGALASLALNTLRIGSPVEPQEIPALAGAGAMADGPALRYPNFAPALPVWEMPPAGSVDILLMACRQPDRAVATLLMEECAAIPVIVSRLEEGTQPRIQAVEQPVWMNPAPPLQPPPCGHGPEPPRRRPSLPLFPRWSDLPREPLEFASAVPFSLRVASAEPQAHGYPASRTPVPAPVLPTAFTGAAAPWFPVSAAVAIPVAASNDAWPVVEPARQQPLNIAPVIPGLGIGQTLSPPRLEQLQPLPKHSTGVEAPVSKHLDTPEPGDRQMVVIPALIPKLATVPIAPLVPALSGMQPLLGIDDPIRRQFFPPAADPAAVAHVDHWPVSIPAAIPLLSVSAQAGRAPSWGDVIPAAVAARRVAGEAHTRAYGSVHVSGQLDLAIPELKVALVSGEPLCVPVVPTVARREDSRTLPLAPPATLRRESVQPGAVRVLGAAATHSPAGTHATRSVEALRRAKDPPHPTPPMCVRIVRFKVTPRPADDPATQPAQPAGFGSLRSGISSSLPVSRLRVEPWTDLPNDPVPIEPPGFAPPADPPMPRLRPVLPAPIAPPSAGPPVPLFRPARRHSLRKLTGWLSTPKGLIAAGALLAVIALQPVWTYIGGFDEIRESMQRSTAAMQSSIGSRSGVQFTEDFTTRFDKWEGRRAPEESWKVDDVGFVIPGELAVYRPSSKMKDYHLEFLGTLDPKALSWAFRVKDFENYFVAKIIVVKPGSLPGLAVERYAVIGGREGPHRINPISLTIRGQSMLKVSMNANGPDFDVRIDGRIVDSWSDSRIEAGGIGFFNAKGDSSKIRWMKVEYQYDILGRVCSWFADSPVIQQGKR
jgi:hypothetical protein